MGKPSVYVLGSSPEILLAFTDTDDEPFVPSEVRLSIEEPTGTVVTFSGGDMTTLSGGILSIVYSPPVIGWYSYTGWGKDNANRTISKDNGFDIIAEIL